VVAGLSSDQLEQMFEAIGELEAACARHAALRMDAPGHACLRALHASAREAMRDQDIDRYDAVNRELHATIVRGAGNLVLSEMAAQLKKRAAPYRRTQFRDLNRMRASFEEHSAIVEAILAHDAAMAYREMRAHLLSAHNAAARLRRSIVGTSRREAPTYSWRGRPIFCSGSEIISLHWLIQPTVRATANSTVNIEVGKPIAFSVMPE
jgi:DNA-binding GntR family transcriptional regulator